MSDNLDRLLLELVMPPNDKTYQASLEKNLATVVQFLKDANRRSTVLSTLSHVNKRVKVSSQVQLPVRKLLALLADNDATVSNVALMYIKMGLPRIPVEDSYPVMDDVLSTLPLLQSDRLFYTLGLWMAVVLSSGCRDVNFNWSKLSSLSRLDDLLTTFQDVLRQPYSLTESPQTNSQPTNTSRPQSAPAVLRNQPNTPTLERYQLLNEFLPSLLSSSRDILAVKLGLVRWIRFAVENEILSSRMVIGHYCISASDEREAVHLESNALHKTLDFQPTSTEVADALLTIYLGSTNRIKTSPSPSPSPFWTVEPASFRLGQSILPMLTRYVQPLATDHLQESMKIGLDVIRFRQPSAPVVDGAVRTEPALSQSEIRFRKLGFDYLSSIFTQLPSKVGVPFEMYQSAWSSCLFYLLTNETEQIPASSSFETVHQRNVITLRCRLYNFISQLTKAYLERKRPPVAGEIDVRFLSILFGRLAREANDVVVVALQLVSTLSPFFAAMADKTQLVRLLSGLLSGSSASSSSPSTRRVAIQMVALTLSADDCQRAFLLLTAIGDRDPVVAELAKKSVLVLSENQLAADKALPSFVAMTSFLDNNRIVTKFSTEQIPLCFPANLLKSIVSFLRKCLFYEAGVHQFELHSQDFQLVTIEDVEKLAVYLRKNTVALGFFCRLINDSYVVDRSSGHIWLYLLELICTTADETVGRLVGQFGTFSRLFSSSKPALLRTVSVMAGADALRMVVCAGLLCADEELLLSSLTESAKAIGTADNVDGKLAHLMVCRAALASLAFHQFDLDKHAATLIDCFTAFNLLPKTVLAVKLDALAELCLLVKCLPPDDTVELLNDCVKQTKILLEDKFPKPALCLKYTTLMCCLSISYEPCARAFLKDKESWSKISLKTESALAVGECLAAAIFGSCYRSRPIVLNRLGSLHYQSVLEWIGVFQSVDGSDGAAAVDFDGFYQQFQEIVQQFCGTDYSRLKQRIGVIWLHQILLRAHQFQLSLDRSVGDFQNQLLRVILSDDESTENVTFEFAAKALLFYYNCASEALKRELADEICTLLLGPSLRAAKETKFEARDALGVSATVCRELCQLALNVGQPSIFYAFLAVAAAGPGGVVNRSDLASMAGLSRETLVRLVPHFFRVRFDPNPKVNRAVSVFWEICCCRLAGLEVGQFKNSTHLYVVNMLFGDLLLSLLKEVLDRSWRVAQCAALALNDLLNTETLVTLREKVAKFPSIQSMYPDDVSLAVFLWKTSLDLSDAMKESVGKAGSKLFQTVSEKTFSHVEKFSQVDEEMHIFRSVVELLVDRIQTMSVKSTARIDCILALVKLCTVAQIVPPKSIPSLMEFMAGFESKTETQRSVYAAARGETAAIAESEQKRLNQVREQLVYGVIAKTIQLASSETLREIVTAMIRHFPRSQSFVLKAGSLHLLSFAEVIRLDQPTAGMLVDRVLPLMRDRSITVRRMTAKTVGQFLGAARTDLQESVIDRLCSGLEDGTFFTDDVEHANDDVWSQDDCARLIDAIMDQKSRQLFDSHASRIVPIVFVAGSPKKLASFWRRAIVLSLPSSPDDVDQLGLAVDRSVELVGEFTADSWADVWSEQFSDSVLLNNRSGVVKLCVRLLGLQMRRVRALAAVALACFSAVYAGRNPPIGDQAVASSLVEAIDRLSAMLTGVYYPEKDCLATAVVMLLSTSRYISTTDNYEDAYRRLSDVGRVLVRQCCNSIDDWDDVEYRVYGIIVLTGLAIYCKTWRKPAGRADGQQEDDFVDVALKMLNLTMPSADKPADDTAHSAGEDSTGRWTNQKLARSILGALQVGCHESNVKKVVDALNANWSTYRPTVKLALLKLIKSLTVNHQPVDYFSSLRVHVDRSAGLNDSVQMALADLF